MKKLNVCLAVVASAVVLACGSAFAQQPQGMGMGMANMDPQQIQDMIQQRIMDNFREQMVVTNDSEWGVIKDRLAKVMRLKFEAAMSGMGTMMGGMGRGMRGGGNGPGGGPRGFPGFGQPDPNAEQVQQALDSNAPAVQVKTALARLRESRKQKQAELAKAQEDLRSVLTMRQEAILVVANMLD